MNTNFYTETENGVNIEANQLNINCLTSNQNKFHLDSDGNLTVNSITTVAPNTNLCNQIYPIGSIYLSVSNTILPDTLFGGRWEQIEDVFLLAAGTSYTAGSTGGSATHTLSVEEMPQHNHSIKKGWSPDSTRSIGVWLDDTIPYADHSWFTTGNTGGNQPHNNMPPYLTVYMWKRIS